MLNRRNISLSPHNHQVNQLFGRIYALVLHGIIREKISLSKEQSWTNDEEANKVMLNNFN